MKLITALGIDLSHAKALFFLVGRNRMMFHPSTFTLSTRIGTFIMVKNPKSPMGAKLVSNTVIKVVFLTVYKGIER